MKQPLWLFGLPFLVMTMGMIIVLNNATQITYRCVKLKGVAFWSTNWRSVVE
jgi:hypothetical protein